VINKYSNSDKQVSNKHTNNSDKYSGNSDKHAIVINKWAYTWVGLYSGGGAYIWNEVSVSTRGGLIHGEGAYIRGRGLICSDVYGTVSENEKN
jgi:hypothetical protein